MTGRETGRTRPRETYRVELANRIERGRCVGNLYGVARYRGNLRVTWVMQPQPDEDAARRCAAQWSRIGGEDDNACPLGARAE